MPCSRRRSETAATSDACVTAAPRCYPVARGYPVVQARSWRECIPPSSIQTRADANDLGAHVSELAGFFYPRTATGQSSLLPAPPWHYSGDLLTVEYRTDPARVAELLPRPLVPAPQDPAAVALIWADWQSCGDSGEELLDPVRAQYSECLAVVRCGYGGRVYSRCVYIWVDSDVALARGLIQGYPKKLGSIHQTRPHPFGRAAPRIAPGGIFAGTLAAGGRRLAQA